MTVNDTMSGQVQRLVSANLRLGSHAKVPTRQRIQASGRGREGEGREHRRESDCEASVFIGSKSSLSANSGQGSLRTFCAFWEAPQKRPRCPSRLLDALELTYTALDRSAVLRSGLCPL